MCNVKKVMSGVITAAMVMSVSAVSSFAATPAESGKYNVEASLSCYVNAMGGVEFSDGFGLLKSTTVEVTENGTAMATLNLGTTSGLSVYGVACTAFIGTDEAPGYYNNDTVTKDNVTYTISSDTVANSKGQVNYLTSITMPVDTSKSEYTMWLYLDSNVMGCQLGNGTGTGSSNTPGVATKHTAKLTINWDSAEKIVEANETTNQTANVEYTVEGGYEVEIPATITVDSTTKKGSYSVNAKNFVIGENAYVKVSASENGELTNGSSSINFTNTLAKEQLKKSGDSLAGTVEVTDSPSNPGKYTGTIDFTINYYAGK